MLPQALEMFMGRVSGTLKISFFNAQSVLIDLH